jgi:hypothetical protein
MEATDPVHPLISLDYALQTPSIAEFGKTIQQWAAERLPGGIVTGYPQTGKTTAIIHWAGRFLRETEGRTLPIIVMTAPPPGLTSRGFYQHLLQAGKLGPWQSGTVGQLLPRLQAGIVKRIVSHDSRYMVFLIDEANNFNLKYWQLLKDLENQLLMYEQLRLTFIAVGSSELKGARRTLYTAAECALTARFMVRQFEFRGVLNLEELRHILSGYDITRWPAADGPTYTEYFLPQAYAEGFRMAQHAQTLWSVFMSCMPAMRGQEIVEIPMVFIVILAHHILRNLCNLELAVRTSAAHLTALLKASGFREHMQVHLTLQRHELDAAAQPVMPA